MCFFGALAVQRYNRLTNMTVQTLKIGRREFILLAKRDFEKLASQAQRQTEDDYWTRSALDAEARSRSRGENPIPFEAVERELDARRRGRSAKRLRRRR